MVPEMPARQSDARQSGANMGSAGKAATQTVFPAADIAHVIVRTTGRVLARCPECERMNFAENGRMLGHLRVDDSLLPRACLGTGKEPSTSIPRESA